MTALLRRHLFLSLALVTGATGTSCSRTSEPSPGATLTTAAGPTAAASGPPSPPPITRLPSPARLVAIGDLHGDLQATRAALRLAGALDDQDRWSGGTMTLVQTGDQLDRGDGERAILDLLDRLTDQARAAGGAVVVLDGNHELMNVGLDFRYVTEGGFHDFAGIAGPQPADPRVVALPEGERGRGAAMLPGGLVAQRLAKRAVVAVIGDTVFVHGGVLPKHVRYGLDRLNQEVSAWMDGRALSPPAIAVAADGPVWTRRYSAATGEDDCKVLRETLAMIPAKRMVVGHTVQRGGISSACAGQVWRIDVGLSSVYGGRPEVLEIAGDTVRALPAP